MEGSFHGRTMGSLALTSKAAYREPFEPLPGRRHVRAVRRRGRARRGRRRHDGGRDRRADAGRGRRGRTAGRVPRRGPGDHTAARRAALDRRGADRRRPHRRLARATPSPASTPDIVTLAKGLGGGIPIGATIGLGRRGDPARARQPRHHVRRQPGRVRRGSRRAGHDREGGPAGGRDRPRRPAPGRILAADDAGHRGRGRGLLLGLELPASRCGRRGRRGAQERGFLLNNTGPTGCASPRRSPSPRATSPRSALAWDLDDRLRRHADDEHFLADDDLSPAEQAAVLELAARLKRAPYDAQPLEGPRTVAMIFDKPTLRTQARFAAGIAELGGYPMLVDGTLAGIGKRESVADVARVLGRQASLIVWRTYEQAADRRDGRARRRARRQRADRRLPPLPAARRPADRARAQGRARRAHGSRSSATAPATWATRGCSPARPRACTS